MENTLIFYFSGTNNTKYLALILNKYFIDSKIIQIDENSYDSRTFISNNIFVLYPTYAYGMPRLVKIFLKNTTLTGDYKALISTGGTNSGNSFSLSYKYKQTFDYYYFIKSIENFTPLFKSVSDNKLSIILNNENIQIKDLINSLNNKDKAMIRRTHNLRFIYYLFLLFRPLLSKMIHQNSKCIKCKACINYCNQNAITFKNNKIKIDSKKCELCQGCINKCTHNGLSLLLHTKKTINHVHELDISDFYLS